jgi:hypothetical protein
VRVRVRVRVRMRMRVRVRMRLRVRRVRVIHLCGLGKNYYYWQSIRSGSANWQEVIDFLRIGTRSLAEGGIGRVTQIQK